VRWSETIGQPCGGIRAHVDEGGNITGLSDQGIDLAGKRFEFLREVVPGLRRLAILINAGNPAAMKEVSEVQAAAGTLGLAVVTLEIRRAKDIAPAFEALKGRADALYVKTDLLIHANRTAINTWVLGARLPTIHGYREDVEAGGLMSYGPSLPDLYRRAAETCRQDSARDEAGRHPADYASHRLSQQWVAAHFRKLSQGFPSRVERGGLRRSS